MSYLYKIPKGIIKVGSKKDVLTVPHYAVIVYERDSVWVPGDERSRTNPGHGYPEHTEYFDSFKHYITTNKEDWLALLEAIMLDNDVKDKFVAFEVSKVANVKSKVVVDVV